MNYEGDEGDVCTCVHVLGWDWLGASASMSERFVQGLEARIRAHRLYSERQVDFYAWVVHQVPWRGGEHVLDVGCGSGAYLPYYRARGARIVGLDVSAQMVKTARERVDAAHFLVGNAIALPFPAAVFDVVFANHVLFFLADIPAALCEIRRVLRWGGVFVAATNTADSQQVLYDLHAWAAARIGRRALPAPHLRFHVENGRAMVEEIFGNARTAVLENAFCFPDVDAALAYYLSGPVDMVEGPPLRSEERRALANCVAEAVAAIVARDGCWRVPKNAGVILARRT